MEASRVTAKRFATMVVLNEDRSKVLLILREDFRIWGLPGGMLEPGESPEHAAIRETLEETGFTTEIVCFCGTHRRTRLNDIRYIYTGRITGGQAVENGPETLAVGWFDVERLPEKTTPFLKEVLSDALPAAGEELDKPFDRLLHVPWTLFITLRWMVWARDLRNRLTGRG
jgi:8-oxo-dGTP diphosphatase